MRTRQEAFGHRSLLDERRLVLCAPSRVVFQLGMLMEASNSILTLLPCARNLVALRFDLAGELAHALHMRRFVNESSSLSDALAAALMALTLSLP